MELSRQQVEHIALLARLGLDEAETDGFRLQLSVILENFEILKQVDTSDVPATAQIGAAENVFRQDRIAPSSPPEDTLANAPQAESGHFKIKPVLE